MIVNQQSEGEAHLKEIANDIFELMSEPNFMRTWVAHLREGSQIIPVDGNIITKKAHDAGRTIAKSTANFAKSDALTAGDVNDSIQSVVIPLANMIALVDLPLLKEKKIDVPKELSDAAEAFSKEYNKYNLETGRAAKKVLGSDSIKLAREVFRQAIEAKKSGVEFGAHIDVIEKVMEFSDVYASLGAGRRSA